MTKHISRIAAPVAILACALAITSTAQASAVSASTGQRVVAIMRADYHVTAAITPAQMKAADANAVRQLSCGKRFFAGLKAAMANPQVKKNAFGILFGSTMFFEMQFVMAEEAPALAPSETALNQLAALPLPDHQQFAKAAGEYAVLERLNICPAMMAWLNNGFAKEPSGLTKLGSLFSSGTSGATGKVNFTHLGLPAAQGKAAQIYENKIGAIENKLSKQGQAAWKTWFKSVGAQFNSK